MFVRMNSPRDFIVSCILYYCIIVVFCYLNLGLVANIWRLSVWTGPPNTQLNIPLGVKE